MTTAVENATRRGDAMGLIQNCTACEYGVGEPVVFRGSTPSRLMLISDAPGAAEVKHGKPLISGPGFWFDRALRDAGLPHLGRWFITTAVKCRPTDDETPWAGAVNMCQTHLRREVALCDPEWVVTLGVTALSSVGVKGAVNKIHGRPFQVPVGPFIGRWVMPTLHPGQVFRDEAKGAVIISDLVQLQRILSGVINTESIQLVVGRNGRLVPPV